MERKIKRNGGWGLVFEEKTVSSDVKYEGRILKVFVDQVRMPDGSLATRELVGHPGGVGVVALNEKQEIVLVKQYRKAMESVTLEIPAGKLDPGEGHRVCGMRELEEVTGLRAGSFEYLGCIYPSPGFTDEVTHLYLATDLKSGTMHPDEDEYLDIVWMPITDVAEKIMKNEIPDAKTVAGVLKTLYKLQLQRA